MVKLGFFLTRNPTRPSGRPALLLQLSRSCCYVRLLFLNEHLLALPHARRHRLHATQKKIKYTTDRRTSCLLALQTCRYPNRPW